MTEYAMPDSGQPEWVVGHNWENQRPSKIESGAEDAVSRMDEIKRQRGHSPRGQALQAAMRSVERLESIATTDAPEGLPSPKEVLKLMGKKLQEQFDKFVDPGKVGSADLALSSRNTLDAVQTADLIGDALARAIREATQRSHIRDQNYSAAISGINDIVLDSAKLAYQEAKTNSQSRFG